MKSFDYIKKKLSHPEMSQPTFFDLDKIVKDFAWEQYKATETKKQKSIRQKEVNKKQKYLDVNIDWSEVRTRHETHWAHLAEDELTTVDKSPTAEDRRPEQADSYTPQLNVVFETKYINNTNSAQEYKMMTEKTTTSTNAVEVESGFTHGVELSVTLKTPCEIFEANAGYTRETSLTNTEGQTFEEQLTWSVESTINVEPKHVAEARLVVNEKKYSGEFVIETRMRGDIYVTFTNVRDNNSFVKLVSGDIVDIIQNYMKKESRRRGRTPEGIEVLDDFVKMKTTGKSNFRFGVSQEVKVDQKELPSE